LVFEPTHGTLDVVRVATASGYGVKNDPLYPEEDVQIIGSELIEWNVREGEIVRRAPRQRFSESVSLHRSIEVASNMTSDKANVATRNGISGVRALVIFLVTALLHTNGALASEVVDLRIGSHPDFTRVVFELDTPAGYRIERASTSADTWELVVSIDATSIPRKVQSTKSLIGLVRISPKADRSVAHIELRRDGLSLKEMILANPPRIVLDILSPAHVAKTESKKSAPVAAAKPAKKPAPKQVAKATPKATPKATAKTTAKASPKPTPKPVAQSKPPAKTTPAVTATTETPVLARTKSSPSPVSAGEPSEGGIPTMGVDASKSDTKPAALSRRTAKDADRNRGAVKPAAKKSSSSVARARLAKEPDSAGSGTLLIAGAGLIAVVFFALFILRRRKNAGDAEIDSDFVDAPESAEPDAETVNPFSGMVSEEDDQPMLGISENEPSMEPAPASFDAETDIVEIGGMEEDSDPAEVKVAAPVDTRLGGEQSMELQDTQAVMGGADQAPVIGTVGIQGGSDDVMRMMREFERRIASLETRLDESADARERLERQVAAQTEELRVQRAAIARTQRAVRNLNRPEDDGPTEPALRDPQ
jgi:hypothetical protein